METNYSVLLPEIVLAITGVVVMVAAAASGARGQRRLGWLALAGLLAAAAAVAWQWGAPQRLGFFGMVHQDAFAQFAKLILLLATAAVTVVSTQYLREHRIQLGEYFSLLLFAAVGMCLMAASADLIMTFLGIEVLSISTYVLAGFRHSDRSAESAWKYFILGAFSTGFLLYGIAFVYGATGSTQYGEVAAAVSRQGVTGLLLLGVALILVGFGFKAALVPFHVWAPDVYEGAPVPVTAHLAVASKAAAFVALARLLAQVLPEASPHWQAVLWVVAVATMALGNIAALSQFNIKRMLAYSSIAHAGYILVGLVAHNGVGTSAVLFYLAAYGFMTIGAFAVVQLLAREDEKYVSLNDYAGLARRYPFLAAMLSVFLVSMAGIPTTAGFMGKLYLFSAAIKEEFYWLVVLVLLASAVGVYYYLRVIVYMYMRDAEGEILPVELPVSARLTILAMAAGTFWLGVFPGGVLRLVSEARIF